MQIITFDGGPLRCALDLADVIAVRRDPAPQIGRGRMFADHMVIQVDGVSLPLIGARRRFGLGRLHGDRGSLIDVAASSRRMAILVDGITHLLSVGAEELSLPTEHDLRLVSARSRRYVATVAMTGTGTFLILDVHLLMDGNDLCLPGSGLLRQWLGKLPSLAQVWGACRLDDVFTRD